MVYPCPSHFYCTFMATLTHIWRSVSKTMENSYLTLSTISYIQYDFCELILIHNVQVLYSLGLFCILQPNLRPMFPMYFCSLKQLITVQTHQAFSLLCVPVYVLFYLHGMPFPLVLPNTCSSSSRMLEDHLFCNMNPSMIVKASYFTFCAPIILSLYFYFGNYTIVL